MDVRDYEQGDEAGLVGLIQAVTARQGAVGWLTVPSAEEVLIWKAGFRPALLVAVDGGTVIGCGAWARYQPAVLRPMAELTKVMTHPDHQGKGAGHAVVGELIQRAGADGAELLTLDVRANNHGAIRLYASHGFEVTGRRPDAIAVGDERFDQVLMHLDLRTGEEPLVRHGSLREGPGNSR